MAKVDWEQVAKDYEASTLDMTWVTSYAQKVAKLLGDHHVSPMGYTDEKQGELDKRIAETNSGSGKVVKFFRSLFSAEPDDAPEKRYANKYIREPIRWLKRQSFLEYASDFRARNTIFRKACFRSSDHLLAFLCNEQSTNHSNPH